MNRTRILFAAVLWVGIIGAVGIVARLWIFPSQKSKLLNETGSSSQYRIEVTGGIDSFPGYAPLRSEIMYNNLRNEGIKLVWHDDKADYVKRQENLRNGSLDIAVFTIDAFITSSLEIGEWPPSATIFDIIDQTKGADGIVAWSDIKNINDLDREDARIVATPKSPSELIGRIVVSQFNLPRLPVNWMIEADGSKAVLAAMQKFKGKPYAFALWEPEKSQALEMSGVHDLLNSSQLDGLIVDVLVANRKFATEHPDVVKAIGEAHLRSVYSYEQKGMLDLIADDANLGSAQAQKVIDGIKWTNTMENYAHFGLVPGGRHIEDIIVNITKVLSSTGAIPSNSPIRGTENKLYYDLVLKDLQSSGFHPARKINLLNGVPGIADLDGVREIEELPLLSPEEWKKLIAVGNVKIESITFGRGSSEINVQSARILKDLMDRLSAFPNYYLLILGNATSVGDPEANLVLAQQRSESVNVYLQSLGLSKNRCKSQSVPPTAKTTSSVSFVVVQRPY